MFVAEHEQTVELFEQTIRGRPNLEMRPQTKERLHLCLATSYIYIYITTFNQVVLAYVSMQLALLKQSCVLSLEVSLNSQFQIHILRPEDGRLT